MKYVMYKDGRNEWRWRLLAANHRIIAVSGEGYHNKIDCQAAIRRVQSSGSAPVVE